MNAEQIADEDVGAAATHLLLALDELQEKMAAVRKAAERLMNQQEAPGDAPHP